MLSTNVSGIVFTNISGIFYAIMLFGVPLYKFFVHKMDNSSLIYPRSEVYHEVRINKTGDKNWFAHSMGTLVRKVFRLFNIQVSPIPINSLKAIVVRCFFIELDGG